MSTKDNLSLYEMLREVPDNAKRPIAAGRLKGKTDINPMWRIKALTSAFGPCGVGWRYEVVGREMLAGAGGETAAFVDIVLQYKTEGGAWSEPIPGTGGSMYIAKERNGLYTNDECYKMALTDAISVAAKAIGVGADVYWSADRTKYGVGDDADDRPPTQLPKCEECGGDIIATMLKTGVLATPNQIAGYARKKFGRTLCDQCMKRHETGG